MNLLIFRPAWAGLSAGKPIAEKANRGSEDGLNAAEDGVVSRRCSRSLCRFRYRIPVWRPRDGR